MAEHENTAEEQTEVQCVFHRTELWGMQVYISCQSAINIGVSIWWGKRKTF